MSEKAGAVDQDDTAWALREVGRLGGFFVLPTTAEARGPSLGGARASARFAALAASVTTRYATDEARIGVSIAHLGLAARLWSPVMACALLHGVVPDLSGLRWADDEGSALCLPDPTGTAVSGTGAVDAMYEQVDAVLRPVERGLTMKIAPRLLDGNVASALVGTASVLYRARPDLGEPIVRCTKELLGRGRLRGTGELVGGDGPGRVPAFRRRSCCLYYRVPGGSKCGDCCLAD
ncbi:(2Fe-2S)-binding protein [Streptomyces sp. BYX5S]